MSTLRALTVKQPWADCIAKGEKLVENRPWETRHSGLLAIHAGKRYDDGAFDDARVQRLLCGRTGPNCWDQGILTSPSWTQRGVIVALAELVDCHPAWQVRVATCCQPWGDPEAYHWVLDNVRALSEPVPCRGSLGLWALPEDVAAVVLAQLPGVAP